MKSKSQNNYVSKLEIDELPVGVVERFYLHIFDDGLGSPIHIPVFVAKGQESGPTLGLTAAVHGNELNGVKVIHKLIADLELNVKNLKGTVIAVPIVNVLGALNTQRDFNNGDDLNRIMPGKSRGNSSEQYVARFIRHIVKKFDYLVDLHTASFGRVNSLYVRADMENEVSAILAKLQHPQIIVHNKGRDGSLRSAASKFGVPSITVEVGDPQKFQNTLIRDSIVGIYNILSHFEMLPLEVTFQPIEPTICKKSYWLYTERGGILEVYPNVAEKIKEGQKVAKLVDVFGLTLKEYFSPSDGIVVGKSVNPISQSGARILHLGIEY